MRRGRLIVPSEDSTQLSTEIIPLNELVVDKDSGKMYKGDGINTVSTLAEVNAFEVISYTTEDATVTEIDTIDITDDTTGIIELRMSAGSTGCSLNGIKYYAYRKEGGTLTLVGNVTAMADQIDGFGSSPSWQGIDSSDEFKVEVTGIAATTIVWKVFYKLTSVPHVTPV
jgi:hypothetical protein